MSESTRLAWEAMTRAEQAKLKALLAGLALIEDADRIEHGCQVRRESPAGDAGRREEKDFKGEKPQGVAPLGLRIIKDF